MRITAEDILRVVQQHGPVVPNRIKQVLQQPDSTLIHVYLSQLRASGSILITTVKLGTSAFYYTPEQKPKLEPLAEHLNEKERRVAYRLRQEKLLQASIVDPLTRVALAQITDFAVPIKVRTNLGEEIFYRYYLVTPQEAEQLIRAKVAPPQPEPEKPKPVEQTVQKLAVQQKPAEKPTVQKSVPKPEKPKPTQQTLSKEEQTPFIAKIKQLLIKKGVRVPELKEIRKNKEAEGMVILETGLGDVQFFCKIKDKKTSNDGDLAEAILAAKAHMLPALYVTTGVVTKKAKENSYLQEITVVELGDSNK